MPQQYNIDDQRSVYSVADAENSNYLLNSSDGDGIQPFELSAAVVRRREWESKTRAPRCVVSARCLFLDGSIDRNSDEARKELEYWTTGDRPLAGEEATSHPFARR
jgi:hypothetical protein